MINATDLRTCTIAILRHDTPTVRRKQIATTLEYHGDGLNGRGLFKANHALLFRQFVIGCYDNFGVAQCHGHLFVIQSAECVDACIDGLMTCVLEMNE